MSYNPSTSNLLEVFNEYTNRVRTQPNHWRQSEVYDMCRLTMRNNLRSKHRDLPPSYFTIEVKATRRLFGSNLGSAFRAQDSDMALRFLHRREFNIVRNYAYADFAELITDKCNDHNIRVCNDCSHVNTEDTGDYTYDGDDWVCGSCRDNNYVYSENRGAYISQDDYDEEQEQNEEEESESRIIGDYHSSKRVLGHIPSRYDNYKSPDDHSRAVLLGLELEVEVNEDYSCNDKAEELYESIKYNLNDDGTYTRYCHIENDGSLNHGFEVVTGYTGLDVHAKQLQFFKSPWRNVRSHDTRTCGLHVHIDKAGMSLFHACKMVFFIHDSGNQKLIKDIARRANVDYAQIKNKKASYSWLKRAKSSSTPLNYLNEDRREALNFQNDNTIEFRLFKGTLRYETIMACLEFTYATWFFCRDTGITELTTPNFIDFICQPQQREHTKFLRAYLKEKDYSIPHLALVKANPRSADYKPQPVEQRVA